MKMQSPLFKNYLICESRPLNPGQGSCKHEALQRLHAQEASSVYTFKVSQGLSDPKFHSMELQVSVSECYVF